MKKVIFIGMVILIILGIATAQAADLPGGKDYPLIKRYEGSEIIGYQSRSYDEYTLALGNGAPDGGFEKSQKVEGALTRILYRVPSGHTSLEIFRNYEQALEAAGFQTLFKQDADGFASVQYFAPKFYRQGGQGRDEGPFGYGSYKMPRYLSAKATVDGKDIYAAVFVVESEGINWTRNDVMDGQAQNIKQGEVIVGLDVVETKAMANKMVEVKSEDMAKAIAKTGKIDIYGILFDTDEADIKPESTPALAEVAKLLKGDPALRLEVAGHTDNTGSANHNMKLSDERAASVVAALVKTYGIDAARLQAKGYGDTKPVAPNDNDEGRAKNRRVELRKI